MRLEEINFSDPIKIGAYDPFDVLPLVRENLAASFPLSNLHWRYDPSKPVKSIPLLPVELVEEFPTLHASQPTAIDRPLDAVYARLIFVNATDLETYRTQTRPLIGEWLKSLVKPHDSMWAIVMISPAGIRDKKPGIIKASAYDKLRTDFGAGGKHLMHLEMSLSVSNDHIIKINQEYADEISKLEVYNNFVALLKQLILQTFDNRFSESSKAIDRLRVSSKDNAVEKLGLFQEKLRLASILKDMRCSEESFEIYEELDNELVIFASSSDIQETSFFSQTVNNDAFDPEKVSQRMDPYFSYCEAVEQRNPIDVFAVKAGIFFKQSILLQTLANFANSISLSAIFVSRLLRKAINLLGESSEYSANVLLVQQWKFEMAGFYQSLPLAKKLVDLGGDQTKNQESMSNVVGIFECYAELNLLKRSILNNLATRKGLESPTARLFFVDVSLKNNSDGEDIQLHNEILISSLKSQSSYEDFYERLTLSAIHEFSICERIKTIDILSIDLAMLHYARNEFREALEILQNSYEYFIQDGWTYVGGVLLEIFMDCIQQVEPESYERLLDTILRLFAISKTQIETRRGINDYNLVKDKDKRLMLFENMSALSTNLESPWQCKLEEFFEVDVLPYIETHPAHGNYFIRARIKNKFEVPIDSVQIAVTVSDDDSGDAESIIFLGRDLSLLESDFTDVSLYSNKFVSGLLRTVNISIEVTSKLQFHSSIDSTFIEAVDETVIHLNTPDEKPNFHTCSQITANAMQMCAVPGEFRIETVSPETFSLGSCGLICVIHTGSRELRNISLQILTSTVGLRIFKEAGQYHFDEAKANSQLKVCFNYGSESRNVETRVICHYEIDGEMFEYHVRESHDLNLKISVSVQDMFRPASIYSKFQIGCAGSSSAVRVSKCDYNCLENKYQVTCSSLMKNDQFSFMVYGDQPAYIFYKVETKAKHFDPADVLEFVIQYSDLREECHQRSRHELWKKLNELACQKYFYLIAPLLKGMQYDLLKYSIDQQARCSNLEECTALVRECVSEHVYPEHQNALMTILDSIFEDGVLLDSQDFDPRICSRELHIPVSVPSSMLHQTEFKIEDASNFIVGRSIDTRLVVSSTSKWSDSSFEALALLSPKKSPELAVQWFELSIVNEDDWLITGLKRQTFAVRGSASETDFEVSLVPLNAGNLVLPKVNIRMAEDSFRTVDVVQKDGLKSILVSSELESVTFEF